MTNMLVEGQLDNETTALSRVIVSNIKERERSLRREPPGSYFQFVYAKDTNGDMQIQRASNRQGFLVMDVYNLKMPPEMKKWVPNLLVNVALGPPKHMGSFDRTNNILTITIGVPVTNNKLDFNATLPWVKAVLRHELEHSRQPKTGNQTNVQDFPWPVEPGKAPSGASWSKPDEVKAYLTHPSEIEGWVTGIYKYAKTAKMAFSDAMEIQLDRAYKSMLKAGADEEKAKSVIDQTRELWLSYVKHRFPKAILKEEVSFSMERWQKLAGISG